MPGYGGEAVATSPPPPPQQTPVPAAAIQQQWSLQALADGAALLANHALQQKQSARTVHLAAVVPTAWPDTDSDSGIFMINAASVQNKGFDGWVLYDTGSGVTACGEHDFSDIPLEAAKALPPMEAATGDGVKIQGPLTVAFRTAFGDIIRIAFQVGNLTRPIISAEAFVEAGCETQLRQQSCKIIMPSGSPLELVRRHASFWLRLERVYESQEPALSLMVVTLRTGAKAVPMSEQEAKPSGSSSSAAPAAAPDVALEQVDARELVKGLPDACELTISDEAKRAKARGIPVMPSLEEA